MTGLFRGLKDRATALMDFLCSGLSTAMGFRCLVPRRYVEKLHWVSAELS